jgi:3',5'-cyclic AMP phosphodiesterase CpdA
MNGGPFGNQLAWLEADLKRAVANRAQVPWILVSGHRPFYSSTGESGVWDASRPAFEPLFNRYSVDLVYWGHVHWYERMYPTLPNGTVQQQSYTDATAPIYIISASPGNVEGLTPGNIAQNYTAFLDNTHFGLGLLEVQNATHLNWTFYDSKTQAVLDHVMIVKEKRWKQLQTDLVQNELLVKAE